MWIEKRDLVLANKAILEKIEMWVVDSHFQEKCEFAKNQGFLQELGLLKCQQSKKVIYI